MIATPSDTVRPDTVRPDTVRPLSEYALSQSRSKYFDTSKNPSVDRVAHDQPSKPSSQLPSFGNPGLREPSHNHDTPQDSRSERPWFAGHSDDAQPSTMTHISDSWDKNPSSSTLPYSSPLDRQEARLAHPKPRRMANMTAMTARASRAKLEELIDSSQSECIFPAESLSEILAMTTRKLRRSTQDQILSNPTRSIRIITRFCKTTGRHFRINRSSPGGRATHHARQSILPRPLPSSPCPSVSCNTIRNEALSGHQARIRTFRPRGALSSPCSTLRHQNRICADLRIRVRINLKAHRLHFAIDMRKRSTKSDNTSPVKQTLDTMLGLRASTVFLHQGGMTSGALKPIAHGAPPVPPRRV